MNLIPFLQSNLPLCGIVIALLIALVIVEFFSHSNGVPKLSTIEAVRFMNKKKALVFDLRKPEAFAGGHIKQSKQVNAADLLKNAKTWIKKLDLPVLLIDEHDHGAVSTAAGLKKLEYTDVAILAGGLNTWRKENLPLSHQ
jgi:rhodanese-related sulfurtransferase